MEQLFDLPKAVQKNVLSFQKKFRENSKSEAIHLEPIITFKDPLLRTARIDQKYRAIIRVPETGDSYYMLWVDNHDEAMDWAKNKIFHWNENTQASQIFTSLTSDQIVEPIQDDSNLGLYSNIIENDLKAIGVPDALMPLVRSIRNIDELGEAEKYLPEDVFERLFYLSEGANIELLKAEVEEGKKAIPGDEDNGQSINDKRYFVEVDDELMSEILNGELSKWQIFLHPTQRLMVESNFKGSVKITGGAGTGKTVVALHRLKHLALLPSPTDKRKVVFTTFTNALTTNLKKLAAKLNIDATKYIITNLDSLVREIAIEQNIVPQNFRVLNMPNTKTSLELWEGIMENNLSSIETDFIHDEYQNVILFNSIDDLDGYLKVSRPGRGKPISRKMKMDIWTLVEKYKEIKVSERFYDRAELFNIVTTFLNGQLVKPYKYVIADEIQDFSNIELRFIRSLVEEKNNDLFLVGDPYQKIYAKNLNFTNSGISIRGNRSKKLRINYRTSEEIKRLAISSIRGIHYDDFDGEEENLNGYLSLFHGEVPTYELFKTKDEENNSVLSYLEKMRESGIQYHEICIGSRTKDALKEIKTLLHKQKLPYHDNSVSTVTNSDGIVLSTFHGMKGLEFKAVILIDVNNRTCPLYYSKLDQLEDIPKEHYFKSERSLLYVAISRAIKELKIVGTGVKSEMVQV